MKIIAYKFVKHEVPPLESLKNSSVYQLRVKLNEGGKLTRQEKNWLTDNRSLGKSIHLRGWSFNFDDVLKTYVIKQHNCWYECVGVDKLSVRAATLGKIDKIMEVV